MTGRLRGEAILGGMPRGIQLGRIFGTDIYASLGFFGLLVLIFIVYGTRNAAFAAVVIIAVVISLLVHEFGHAFAARWLLKSKSKIVLWFLGGLCIHEPAKSPGQQVGISLMGPGFAAVLAGLVAIPYFTMPDDEGAMRILVEALLWINVVWTAANLLPILPLDGGQALRALLHMRLGARRSLRVARMISMATAAAAGAVAIYYGYRFAAILCVMLLLENMWGRSVTYH
jgi:Zn-dependent protease